MVYTGLLWLMLMFLGNIMVLRLAQCSSGHVCFVNMLYRYEGGIPIDFTKLNYINTNHAKLILFL